MLQLMELFILFDGWVIFQCVCVYVVKVKMLVSQSCPTLCDPMDYSLPGSSVHEILQARILEWVAIPFSRGSSRPRDQIWVSCIAGGFFTVWSTREAHIYAYVYICAHTLGFPSVSDCKASAHNAGDLGSIPGLGRSPGEGNGYPL